MEIKEETSITTKTTPIKIELTEIFKKQLDEDSEDVIKIDNRERYDSQNDIFSDYTDPINVKEKTKTFQISFSRYVWTNLVIFVSWFSILSVPYPIVYVGYNLTNESDSQVWFTILCYTADFFFLIDIILRVVFPTLMFRSKIWAKVYQKSGLRGRMQYLCSPSAFGVDILSMLPLELIGIGFTGQYLWLLRFNKLFRFLRFSHLWKLVNKYQWEHQYTRSIHVRRMWTLFFTMAVSSHFAGLFFYLLALEIARDPNGGGINELIPEFGTTTWAERDGLWTIMPGSYLNSTTGAMIGGCTSEYGFYTRWNSTEVLCLQSSALARYFRSFYWAVITMVTIGFGDIVPTTVSGTTYTTIALFIGITITSCAVANLSRMASSLDSEETEQQNYIDQVERYLEFRRVSDKTKTHVRHYFKYGRRYNNDETNKVFQGFPLGTKMAAIEDAPFRVLHACPAFSSLPDSLVHALAGRLKLETFIRDQMITIRGARCKTSLFLRRGQAAVVADIDVEHLHPPETNDEDKDDDDTSSIASGETEKTSKTDRTHHLRLLTEGSCLGLQALIHPNTWRKVDKKSEDPIKATNISRSSNEEVEGKKELEEPKVLKELEKPAERNGLEENSYDGYMKVMADSYPVWRTTIVSKTYCECWTLAGSTFVTTVCLAANPGHRHHSHHVHEDDLNHPHHPENFVETIRRNIWDAYQDNTSTRFYESKNSMRAVKSNLRWIKRSKSITSSIGMHDHDDSSEEDDEDEDGEGDACCSSCCVDGSLIQKAWFRHMHPQSKFRRIWTVMCFIGITFNTFSVPGAVAFLFSGTYVILLPAILIDIFFVFDIILNLYAFAYYDDKTGTLIRDAKKIKARYVASTSFKIDVIAALPLDFFAFAAPTSALGYQYLPLLRLVKVVRVSHLYEYFENMENLALESGIKVCSTALRRLIRLYFLLVCCLHWCACGWYLVGQVGPMWSFGDGWMRADQNDPNRNIDTINGLNGLVGYFRALYFIIVGASTVGYGDIVPTNTLETVYATAAMLFGGLLKPAVVGGIAALIFAALSLELPVHKYNRRMRAFFNLERHHLSIQLKEQMSRYSAYLRDRPSLFVESMVLRDLPNGLKSEVLEAVVGGSVRALPFWKTIEPDREFFDDIVAAVTPRHYLPSTYIVYEGEFGKAMFFLCSGKAIVTVATVSVPVAQLVSGQFFGETAMLDGPAIRTANVISTSFCDCFVLDRDDFKSIVLLHNIDSEKLEHAILDKLNKNIEQNREIEAEMISRPNTPVNEQVSNTTTKNSSVEQETRLPNFEEQDEVGKGDVTNATIVATKKTENLNVEEKKNTLFIARENSYAIDDNDIYGWQHPDSTFKKYWNIMLMVGVVYYIVITPVRLAFVHGVPIEFYAIDGLLDTLYIADIILRARYFAVLSNGKLYKTKNDLWIMYKKESLLKDLITSLPFGILALIQINQPIQPLESMLWTLALLRINKLLHVRRLFSLGIHIKSLLGLFTLIIFIGNFVGAVFYMIARLNANYPGEEKYDSCVVSMLNDSLPVTTTTYSPELTSNVTAEEAAGLCKWDGTWLGLQFTDNLLPLNGGTQMERSLRSFNWAMPTLLVVVIGDTTPVNLTETLYVSAAILVGLIVNAMVLGVMADRLTDTASEKAKHRANMDMVERWLILSNIGDNVLLCDRIRDHMRTTFYITKGVDEEQIYKEMPKQLRHDSATQLRVPILQQCYVLESTSIAFIQALAERLHFRHYSGGDVICLQGEYLSEMFSIKLGRVELIQDDMELLGKELEKEPEKESEKDLEKEKQVSEKINDKNQNDKQNNVSITSQQSNLEPVTQKVKIIGKGATFGSLSMVSRQPVNQSAEALEHVAVYVLKRRIFLDILKQFPNEVENIPNLKMIKSTSSLSVGGNGDNENDGTLVFGENVQVLNELNERIQNNEEASKKVQARCDSSSSKNLSEKHSNILPANSSLNAVISTVDYKHNWATWAARWQLHSFFRDIWAVISLINLFYFLVLIPLRIVLLIEDRVTTTEMFGWYTYGYLVDIFFLVDMFLRARRFHVSVDDVVISDPTEISKRYFSVKSTTGMLNTDNNEDDELIPWWYPSEFVVELISSLPIDFLALVLGISSLKFLRLNRLLRSVWRMPELMEAVDRFVHQKFHLWSGFYSIMLKVWVSFWLANHLCACGYIFIHRYLERNVEFTWATVDGVSTWNPVIGEHDIFHDRTLIYNRAFYFVTVVVSTCGYGDIRPYTNYETLFAQFVTLCGALSLASMVGTFLFYFQYFDDNGMVGIRQKFRGVMEYGEKRKWKYSRVKQLQRQCDYIWEETRFLSERRVLKLLSVPLQMDVVAITRAHIVSGSHMFRNIHALKRCSLYLATCLRLEIFVRGQQVYHFGEPTVGFFILSEGAVDVSEEDDIDNATKVSSHTRQMNNIVRPIGHFGSWSKKHKCRVDSAIAVEDSHLYRCSVEDMFEVLERMGEMDATNFVKDILV